MESLISALRSKACLVVDEFYATLARLPKSRQILGMLSAEELSHLKLKQIENLRALAAPDLSADDHAVLAQRIGRIHAIVGLDKEELVRSRSILTDAFDRLLSGSVPAHELAAYNRRLTVDLAEQLKAYQQLQASQQEVLLRVTRMVWGVGDYAGFCRELMAILSEHDEICGCGIGRPDESGVFHFEDAPETAHGRRLPELDADPATGISVLADNPLGQGAIGLAWRGGKIERIANFSTSPEAAPWLAAARAAGIRSSVAVPVGVPGSRPTAVLVMHSAYPGGLSGTHQLPFVELLKTLLDRAFMSFPADALAGMVPHAGRAHWAALLRSDAFVMYYQPLLDLRTGKVSKVEALARIRDGDTVHTPGDFLPALGSDDTLELFARGLDQSLRDRGHWLEQGVLMALSVNLPPAALNDIRYFKTTQQVLAEHHCPPGQLTLEVLESEALSLAQGQRGLLENFRQLGVALAQDDLGSGHSGLANLGRMPFQWVKFDRDLVALEDADVLVSLRLLYQMTRLSHSIGKSVVAEGVDSLDFLNALKILGVDVGQGYAIARPMPPGALLPWLAANDGGGFLAPAHRGVLSRLARLLVWEEWLVLNAELPRVDEPDFIDKNNPAEQAALEAVLRALAADGPRSAAFDAAQAMLVAAVSKERGKWL